MRLIKPSFEVITNIQGLEILKKIELAGRTCYKSEDKITEDSAPKFVQMILNRGHESVLEHESLSVRFICDRGVSHEFVRHRLSSFSQESTRYCNYGNKGISFIIPSWLNADEVLRLTGIANKDNKLIYSMGHDMSVDHETRGICSFLYDMSNAEHGYNFKLKMGWRPEQARSVLPNALKTEIVITANLRQWREMFRQRTAKVAHPQMRELMCPLLDEMKIKLPIVFNDINY